MSALTPEKVCDSYKWLLHIGNNNLPGSTLYTGIGSAVPITFISSNIISTTAINIANITSSQPFRIKVAGALSAMSFLMNASGGDASNTIARMVDNNNSGIAAINSSTFANVSGSSVINTFFNTRQFCTLTVCDRTNNTHIIQNDTSDSYRGNLVNSFIPNCNAGTFCQVWNSHGYAPYTFNSFSILTFTVGSSASFDAAGCSTRSSHSRCCADNSMRSSGFDINSSQIALNNDTPKHNSTAIRYGANNASSNVRKYNTFEHVTCDNAFTVNDNSLVNYFQLGGGNNANNKNSATLYPLFTCVLNAHNSLIIGGTNQCRVTNSFARESTGVGMSGNNIFAMKTMTGLQANKLSSTEPVYYNSCWAFTGNKVLNVTCVSTATWTACLGNNILAYSGQACADNVIQLSQSCNIGQSQVVCANSVYMNTACTVSGAISSQNSTVTMGFGGIICARNSFSQNNGSVRLNGRNSAALSITTAVATVSANQTIVQTGEFYLDNLPSLSAGLPCGHLWVDPTTRNLRIVLA